MYIVRREHPRSHMLRQPALLDVKLERTNLNLPMTVSAIERSKSDHRDERLTLLTVSTSVGGTRTPPPSHEAEEEPRRYRDLVGPV